MLVLGLRSPSVWFCGLLTWRQLASSAQPRRCYGLYTDPALLRLRRLKRLFATVLFGGTFLVAAYLRRGRAERLRHRLEGCERLPDDPNFASTKPLEFFRFKSCVLPGATIKSGTMEGIQDFEAKETDVFVIGFPRTGITWTQEIVYLIENNLNFEKAANETLETRFPTLENPYPGLRSIVNSKEPRMIKSHLPYWLLPPSVIEKAKIIYITRNPKDVAVSYYHFLRLLVLTNYIGTFEEFIDKFMKDEVPYSPYMKHALSYWEHREDPSILYIFYEDLKRDPEGTIKRIAHFLDRPLTDDQTKLLLKHTQFLSMAENPSVNYSQWQELGFCNRTEAPFFRKGVVGDWKIYFSDVLEAKFNQWARKNLDGKDLEFEYE